MSTTNKISYQYIAQKKAAMFSLLFFKINFSFTILWSEFLQPAL
jgi:hypothetical protein